MKQTKYNITHTNGPVIGAVKRFTHRGISSLLSRGKTYGHEIFATVCMLLTAFIGYNLGRITALDQQPLRFGQDATVLNALTDTTGGKIFKAGESAIVRSPQMPRDPRVVTSKNSSSKKYHYSNCPGAKRIKPENQIWFENEKAAQGAGYTLAGNCQ